MSDDSIIDGKPGPGEAARRFLDRADHRNLIGGSWEEAQSGERFDTHDPATGEVLGTLPRAGKGDIDAAVAAARKALKSGPWPKMTPMERSRMLWAIADILEAHIDELAELETLDQGKALYVGRWAEIPGAINQFRYFGGMATKIEGSTIPTSIDYQPEGKEVFAYTQHAPVGVVGAIVPWNSPLVLTAMKLAPALAAGCTIVLKPAENTSLTAVRLMELMVKAGLPDGVVNLVTGYGNEAGAALAAHPGVAKIAFTGSTATGRAILDAAKGNLKRVTLELGGKSPVIVMDDADLDAAIPGAANAIYFNGGQVCIAGSRLYAHRSVFDRVVEGVAAQAEVRLPILAAVPFAETLEVSGAARYSDYSTVGGTFTWNVSGLYAPTRDILFRGTYAEAVRAPNINELFNPAQGEFFRPVDPCDIGNLVTAPDPTLRQNNCSAFFNEIGFDPTLGTGSYAFVDPLTARFSGSISGNEDLQEETATTWTVGAQLTPRFLPGLVLSVDYYNIEIEDAINPVSSQDIVDNCVDSASIENSFCDLIERSPTTGGFTFLRQSSLNFARQETAGVEAALQYAFDLGDFGLTFNASGTWVDKLNDFFDPADPNLVDPELGELQRPEWAGRASLALEYGVFGVTWATTYLDSMGLRAVEIEEVGTTGADTFSPENALTDETFIHDVTFSIEASDMFEIYGGVNNIFDEKPFVTEQAYPVSPVGTYFFLGATVRM